MRSPIRALAGLANKAPVPYVSRGATSGHPWHRPAGTEGQLRAMGSVGTLFAIVDRNATSTAAVDWHLYRKAKPGQEPEEREEVTRHLALDIWNEPNDHFTRDLFVETYQQHYELVGEGWWVVARDPRVRSLPLELWPVLPHRIHPIPDREDFLAGYMYLSPDGEQIPLGLDEVIRIRRPNPIDPYRGIGPVQTILADLEGVQLSAEWNRNFFLNSAEPGGIIRYDTKLSDDDFDLFRDRWHEQHRGVANAHRVAIIEQGEWVDRKYTNRDMQFTELRGVSREVIREAFGMPKFAIGDVDDVNRATADASKTWYAEHITVPRLERTKQALNSKFLPLFGATGQGLEFDYESPVPGDREADDRERDSKTAAYKTLVDAGAHPDDAADVVGLPRMRVVVRPAPEPAVPEPAVPAARLDVHHHVPAPLPAGQPVDTLSVFDLARARPARPALLRAAVDDDEPAEVNEEDLPDLGPVQEEWEEALERLLADWEDLTEAQRDQLLRQIRARIEAGDLEGLTELEVPTEEAEEPLTAAMVALAAAAAAQVVREAADQDVEIDPVEPGERDLAEAARVTVRLLAGDLATSAGREAMRVTIPGQSGEDEAERVAELVQEHLESLTDARPRQHLGAALTSAQHSGRAATLQAAEDDRALPSVAYYGREQNDPRTCRYCREVDKRWLGNTYAEALAEYPNGGYVRCEGRDRCRGMVVAVWRGGEDDKGWLEKEPAP